MDGRFGLWLGSLGQRLNLLGIGGSGGGNSNHGDVSWKQNRDYELMLKRLNTTTAAAGGDEGKDEDEERIRVASMVPDGFVRVGASAGAGAGTGEGTIERSREGEGEGRWTERPRLTSSSRRFMRTRKNGND